MFDLIYESTDIKAQEAPEGCITVNVGINAIITVCTDIIIGTPQY